LASIEKDPRYGFGREALFHHKPSNAEASQLRLVGDVPVHQERRSEPLFTLDGGYNFPEI